MYVYQSSVCQLFFGQYLPVIHELGDEAVPVLAVVPHHAHVHRVALYSTVSTQQITLLQTADLVSVESLDKQPQPLAVLVVELRQVGQALADVHRLAHPKYLMQRSKSMLRSFRFT